jgi:hypothetical protein
MFKVSFVAAFFLTVITYAVFYKLQPPDEIFGVRPKSETP